MKTRALVFLSVAAVGVGACSGLRMPGSGDKPPPPQVSVKPEKYPDCDGKKTCKVNVSVQSCTGRDSNITATPDHLKVPLGKVWTIEWTITTPGYEFTDDGITFKPAARVSEIFSAGERLKGPGNKFAVEDDYRHEANKGHFKYTIKVENSKSKGSPCWKDPSVDND